MTRIQKKISCGGEISEKKKIEHHTKKWEITLQRREKLRNFILESFVLK